MRTKTFNINNDTIYVAIQTLIWNDKKVNKQTIIDSINEAISRIVERGNVDTTLFPEPWDDLTENQIKLINKYYNKYKNK